MKSPLHKILGEVLSLARLKRGGLNYASALEYGKSLRSSHAEDIGQAVSSKTQPAPFPSVSNHPCKITHPLPTFCDTLCSVRPFKKGVCFRYGGKDHLKKRCRNPFRCFKCLRFGHSYRRCRTTPSPRNLKMHPQQTTKQAQNSDVNPQIPNRVPSLKAFLPFTREMAGISSYLDKAVFVESFGRSIKVEDVSTTLAHKAKKTGSWSARKLPATKFFVSCPNCQTVQSLMANGHIRGDGFTAIVNHWNQVFGGVHHNLRFKVYATIQNLPLVCWTAEVVATVLSSFGVPHSASKQSLRWEDLRGFDVVFFCEALENIPEKVQVTVGPYTYSVTVLINYV